MPTLDNDYNESAVTVDTDSCSVGTLATSEEIVLDWRAHQFAQMGFAPEDCASLALLAPAEGRHWVDTEYVRALLANGCSHSCALGIVL